MSAELVCQNFKMRIFKKGQLDRWKWQEGVRGEILLINQ